MGHRKMTDTDVCVNSAHSKKNLKKVQNNCSHCPKSVILGPLILLVDYFMFALCC